MMANGILSGAIIMVSTGSVGFTDLLAGMGTGASGMAQTFSDSEQGVIAVSVGNQLAGTEIILKDTSGKTLISYKPELDFAVVILSAPDIVKGQTYTITIGSQSGEFEAS